MQWGLIGASNIARQYMIRAMRAQPDTIVRGVFGSDFARTAAYASENDLPIIYRSVDEVLSDPEVDAVYISTTNQHHRHQTIAAVKAGKHVLCEKPLALTLDDARSMKTAAEQADVVLATNHHLRNAGLHRRMRDLVADGSIGDVLAVRVFHAVLLPPFLQSWRIDRPDAGGGVVLDITVHDADTVRFVLGDNPMEVAAMTASHGMGKQGLADTVMGVIRMESGALVQFHDAFTVRHAQTGFEIHGTTGSLLARNCMTQNPDGDLILRRDSREQAIDDFDRDDMYIRSVNNFQAAVAGTGQPSATAEDGLWSLATALATQEAADSGQTVRVSPP